MATTKEVNVEMHGSLCPLRKHEIGEMIVEGPNGICLLSDGVDIVDCDAAHASPFDLLAIWFCQ